MKKFLHFLPILCACLLTSFTMAQSIQLSTDSGIVSNGYVFNVWGDTGQAITFASIHIKNISTRKIGVKAKKIEDSLITGATVSMCLGSSCYSYTTFITPNPDSININAIDSTFSGHYNSNDHVGESIVTFVFFNSGHSGDSAWIVVHLHAAPTGIKEISSLNAKISNFYPNPASNFTPTTRPATTSRASADDERALQEHAGG